MPRILAFDVNETLLDLSALDPLFERTFGGAALRAQWFAQMLQLAFVTAITGGYVDFTTAQHAALRMLAARTRTALSDEAAEEIVGGMRSLPAYPDAAPALDRLREGGFTLCALTNSPLDVVDGAARRRRAVRPLRGHPLRRPGAGGQARPRALRVVASQPDESHETADELAARVDASVDALMAFIPETLDAPAVVEPPVIIHEPVAEAPVEQAIRASTASSKP